MKILVLTPIYATTTSQQGATPVVHYFTREWVKMGHEVTVFHLAPQYPLPLYWIGKRFQHQLNARLGMLVPVTPPKDKDFIAEGVTVHRCCVKKTIPHARYSNKQIRHAVNCIVKECENKGIPDWFVGHWDNPQLEVLCALKQRFHKPICLVLHSNKFDFEGLYGNEARPMLAQVDVVGFRNKAAKDAFVKKYGQPKKAFIAYSGVSEAFLNAGNECVKVFTGPMQHFIYVGSLINRKYPTEIITALSKAYPEGNFTMTYIGDGADKSKIEEEYKKQGKKGTLKFTGRIPREEIVEYLKQSDVFIMISKGEIFGLVYLEAMALGVIPVGSKNEGIDGVIRDGENGFLCEAGNVEDLTNVLKKLKAMPTKQIEQISRYAKETANEYSDKGVAEKYLNTLSSWDSQDI